MAPWRIHPFHGAGDGGPGRPRDGAIRARDVEVAGTVEGDIWASNHVHLAPTGRIQGDVSAIHLRVDDGRCVMQGPDSHRNSGSQGPRMTRPPVPVGDFVGGG